MKKQCKCGDDQSVINKFCHGHNRRSRSAHPPGIPADLNNYDIRFIPLTQNLYATVDASDYDRLMEYNWHILDTRGNIYATTTIDCEEIYMQHILMNPPEGMVTVHLDTNSLNNRKANLRNATQQQATWTRRPMRTYRGRPCFSKYKGVTRGKDGGFQVAIIKDKHSYDLGTFANEIHAAQAYDTAARKHFGEFGFTNFDEQGNCNIED